MCKVKQFLLMNDGDEFSSEGAITHRRVVQQFLEELAAFKEGDVSVDIFLIQFLENSGPELSIVNFKFQHGHRHLEQDQGLLTIEDLNVLESDGHDDAVEGVVDIQVVSTELLEHQVNMILSEPFDVVLRDEGGTLSATASTLQVGAFLTNSSASIWAATGISCLRGSLNTFFLAS